MKKLKVDGIMFFGVTLAVIITSAVFYLGFFEFDLSRSAAGGPSTFMLTNITHPYQDKVIISGDMISLTVIYGEPLQLVELCYIYKKSWWNIQRGCETIGPTDKNGNFSTQSQVTDEFIGKWQRWAKINGVKSNSVEYFVVSGVATPAPTPKPASPY